jgi:hypothetical protein
MLFYGGGWKIHLQERNFHYYMTGNLGIQFGLLVSWKCQISMVGSMWYHISKKI